MRRCHGTNVRGNSRDNIKKLEFSIKCIKYLGFIISIDGIKADLEKMLRH